VRSFAIVTATVLIVIGVGVGLLAGTKENGLRSLGTVHGRLGAYESGGINTATNRTADSLNFGPLAGSVEAVEGATPVATVRVTNNGQFLLRLPSGTYRLEGRSSGSSVRNEACGPTVIRLRAHGVASATVSCGLLEIP
jgi:hypothetical protein